jgi:hypothetical protein
MVWAKELSPWRAWPLSFAVLSSWLVVGAPLLVTWGLAVLSKRHFDGAK